MAGDPPDFVHGIDLSRAFYREAVRPILDVSFPGIRHAAALLGDGSEVLGFDDAMSSDHHWGPRVQIFVEAADHALRAADISESLRARLPHRFRGYPTSFTEPDASDRGVQRLEATVSGPVNHRVDVSTIDGFLAAQLGVDVTRPLQPADWLTIPQQRLCSVMQGAVFHDDIGLESARARFVWYPHDVWLYLLAAGWARIGQEEHLMGRAGFVGDELGSALIGARLVRDVMRLAFLMERQYAPYAKWFGSAFHRLACAAELEMPLRRALRAETWQERESGLVAAYEALARLHNRLGVTPSLCEEARHFFARPFRVMALHGFVDALLEQIADAEVKAIATRPLIGSVDLFSDNTDLLEAADLRPQLRSLYE